MQNKTAVYQLGHFVTHHPWWIILLTLLIIFASSAGIKNLKFNNDYRAYFSSENPQLQAFEAIQKTYSKSDNILFIVKPVDGDVLTQRSYRPLLN